MGSHHGEGGQWAQTLLIEHFCIAIWHASPLRLAFPISTKKIIALDPCIASRQLPYLPLIKKGMFLSRLPLGLIGWLAKLRSHSLTSQFLKNLEILLIFQVSVVSCLSMNNEARKSSCYHTRRYFSFSHIHYHRSSHTLIHQLFPGVHTSIIPT